MSREAHVRFSESRGLQRPRPLAETKARKRFAAKSARHPGNTKHPRG
jgi:hypothetical protein